MGIVIEQSSTIVSLKPVGGSVVWLMCSAPPVSVFGHRMLLPFRCQQDFSHIRAFQYLLYLGFWKLKMVLNPRHLCG